MAILSGATVYSDLKQFSSVDTGIPEELRNSIIALTALAAGFGDYHFKRLERPPSKEEDASQQAV